MKLSATLYRERCGFFFVPSLKDKYCFSKPDLILKACKSLSVLEIKMLYARGKISVGVTASEIVSQHGWQGKTCRLKSNPNLSSHSNGILSQFTFPSFFCHVFYSFKSFSSFFRVSFYRSWGIANN